LKFEAPHSTIRIWSQWRCP